MDYPVGRLAGILVICISFLLKKELILRVRDLPVEQKRDLCKKGRSIIFNFQLKLIEKMMVLRANTIITTAPDFINYIHPRTSNIFVFPHGVCKEKLRNKTVLKEKSDKYILAYAGGLDRGGVIEQIISMFSKFQGWEFWITGEGGEYVAEKENTKYFGFMSYLEVQKFYEKADAIVIPYPDREYYNICIPLKIGEVLATCRPIIMLRLSSIERYLRYLDLESNVIYINDWSEKELKNALEKVKSFNINIIDTLNKLEKINWEYRVEKLIEEVDQTSSKNLDLKNLQPRWI